MCYMCPKPALLSKSSEVLLNDAKADTAEFTTELKIASRCLTDILSRNRVPEVGPNFFFFLMFIIMIFCPGDFTIHTKLLLSKKKY